MVDQMISGKPRARFVKKESVVCVFKPVGPDHPDQEAK